jgi:hypothetical protein
MQHATATERKTPAPVKVDRKAAFVVRVLMSQRGLSEQDLANQMLLAGIKNAPARSTIGRIVREGAVPQERHKRAVAEFFYGPAADPTTIWKVRR